MKPAAEPVWGEYLKPFWSFDNKVTRIEDLAESLKFPAMLIVLLGGLIGTVMFLVGVVRYYTSPRLEEALSYAEAMEPAESVLVLILPPIILAPVFVSALYALCWAARQVGLRVIVKRQAKKLQLESITLATAIWGYSSTIETARREMSSNAQMLALAEKILRTALQRRLLDSKISTDRLKSFAARSNTPWRHPLIAAWHGETEEFLTRMNAASEPDWQLLLELYASSKVAKEDGTSQIQAAYAALAANSLDSAQAEFARKMANAWDGSVAELITLAADL